MDVENANCKIRVSECADMDLLSVERPIKIDQEITELQKLVEELHRVFSHDHVNVQDVQKLMAGYKSDPKDWRKYAKFDRFRPKGQAAVRTVKNAAFESKSEPLNIELKYTRNLVDAGNGAFNIMILCWGPGHASAIHDHADSHCFMKVLSGNLEEIRYDWPENVEPEVIRKLKNKNKPRRRCCSESEDKILNGLTSLTLSCQNDSCHNFGGKIEDYQNGGHDNGNGNHKNGNLKYDNEDSKHKNGNAENENGKGEHDSGNSNLNNGNVKYHNGNGKNENGKGGHDNGNGYEYGDEDGYEAHNMEEIGRTRLEINDVCYINDALGLHRMENPSHVDGAVSLHLYCPPFDSCRVFDARTGKPTQVQVTFWSMYGKKIKRVIEANHAADSQ